MDKEQIEKVVNHPPHYAGVTVEPIEVAEHYGFLIGNAIKYLWRAGKKEGASEEQDLRKALFYLGRWLTGQPSGELPDYEGFPRESTVEESVRLSAKIVLLANENDYIDTLFGVSEYSGEDATYAGINSRNVVDLRMQVYNRIKEIEDGNP